MNTTNDNRKYERFLVGPHLDCRLHVRYPEELTAQLSDISQGGMMVLLTRNEDIDALVPPVEIEAELISENTALQFAFKGRVAWKREFSEGRKAFASLGIEFSLGTALPRTLLDAVSEDPA